MGFNIATIAIRGKPIQDIHGVLGLRATESREEDPEAPVVGAMLPSGWYQLYFNDRSCPGSEGLKDLSLNAELIFLDVCETAMASSASCWQNGKQVWSIVHDSRHGLEHLKTNGDTPACCEPISQRLMTLQKEKGDADYIFDVPIEVTLELTGFRYDGNPNGYPVSEFTVLERTNEPESMKANKPCTSFRKRMYARWYDRVMATYEEYLAERRRKLFASLSGSVMEIGPGTGANLAHLPKGCHWIGIEPNPFMHDQLREKAEDVGVEAEFRVATAEGTEMEDACVDAVLCTLVLCSVADPSQVLTEVKRVLKPGGRFYFIEHVAAPRKTWLRLSQRVMRPVWRFWTDGCCPDRETGAEIEEAGFETVEIDEFRVGRKVVPRFVSPHIAGVATK